MSAVAHFPPTARQMEAWRFIAGYAEAHAGLMPTLDEIAAGLPRPARYPPRGRTTAKRMVDGLVARGLLARRAASPRGLALLSVPPIPHAPDGAPLQFVPLWCVPVRNYGDGAAGRFHGGGNA